MALHGYNAAPSDCWRIAVIDASLIAGVTYIYITSLPHQDAELISFEKVYKAVSHFMPAPLHKYFSVLIK